MPNSECCSENAPKRSVKPPCRNSPLTPLFGLRFLCPKGEMLSVFFRDPFLETSPTNFGFFFRILSVLVFLARGFLVKSSGSGVGECVWKFFPQKCLLYHPKTLRSKVLSFLAFYFRVPLFLGFVSGGFWGVNSDFVLV